MTNIGTYDSAQAHAYRVLNRAVDKLGDSRQYLIGAVKWEWFAEPERMQHVFSVYIGVDASGKKQQVDIIKRDSEMFDDEWYDQAAEEIAAWVLLLRGK